MSTYVVDKATGRLVLESGPEFRPRDPGLATMCQEQRAPSSRTDADYWRRKPKTLGKICEESPLYGQMVVNNLKQKGVRVSMDGHYDPLGADEPGDPTNYFDPAHGRNEWQDRMQAKAKVAKPQKEVPLKDSLIREEIQKRVTQNPGLLQNKRKKSELREQIIDEHARKKRPVKTIDEILP